MFVNFGSPIVLSVLCFYFHYFRDEFPRRFQIKYQDKMSFIIISLSLVSYQDSSKVILTSTMAQNKLGRHHDNGKSFPSKVGEGRILYPSSAEIVSPESTPARGFADQRYCALK